MKNMRLLVFFWVCVVSFPSFAGTRVEDPQNILGQSDQFLGNVSFESAFHCGDKAVYENNECRLECNNDGCKELCSPPVQSQLSVTACSTDSVTLQSEKPGEAPGAMIVTRQAYAVFNGNWLRYLLSQQGEEGSDKDFITVDKTSFVDYQLQNGQIVKGMSVSVTINSYDKENKMYMLFPIIVTLGKDIPSVGQQLSIMVLPELGKTPVLRLLSIERHQ